MCPVQFGIGRYHLRLKPNAELHPQLVDLIHQIFQSAFQLPLIYLPVSQRTVVAVPCPEPTVVHDQHLYAQLRSLRGNLQQLFGVKVKIGSLPVIDQDRTLFVSIWASDQMFSV